MHAITIQEQRLRRLIAAAVISATVGCSAAVQREPTKTAEPLSDTEISSLLVGTWRAEENGGPANLQDMNYFRKDGVLQAKSTITSGEQEPPLRFRGRWRVVDRYIIATVRKSNVPQVLRPGLMFKDYVLSVDTNILKYRSEQGKVSVLYRVQSGAPAQLTPTSSVATDVGRAFAELPDFMPEDSDESKEFGTHYATLWSAIDHTVLDALNDRRPLEEVQALLRSLPGYEQPKPPDEVQIGGAVFYNDPGSPTPSYWLFRPEPDDNQLLIGCYNHKWYSPGRVSIYSNRNGVWSRSAAVDGEEPIRPFVVTTKDQDHTLGIVTIEEFIGGDRSEGTLRLWLLQSGELVSQGSPYSELVDFGVSFSGATLSVQYRRFLSCMCEATLGARLEYQLIVRGVRGGIEAERTSSTPWLETLNELYCRVSGRTDGAASALIEKPSDLEVMKPECGSIAEHDGNIEKGTAFAVVRDRTGDFRLEFVKDVSDIWKIVRVTKTAGIETEPSN